MQQSVSFKDSAHFNLEKAPRSPSLHGDSIKQKRQQLLDYFLATWEQYESLYAPLQDEAFYVRAETLRHPLIFYFGHTATFWINKMMLAQFTDARINPALESMFAIGVDEMSWDDLDSSHYDWPAVTEVKAYRDLVRERVKSFIRNMPMTLPITRNCPAWLVLMGIEHERIHLETSSVIMRMLPLDLIDQEKARAWPACPASENEVPLDWHPVPATQLMLGKTNDDQHYSWDNEYGCQQQDVATFKASTTLVSNQAFLQFVMADGYQETRYWTDEGRQWLAYTRARHPRFWRQDQSGNYLQRNLFSEMPLPMDWPVEVNYLEAKAYCNWLTAKTGEPVRLPTEAEWAALRESVMGDSPAVGNINLEQFASSCPVTANRQGKLYDLTGNVWQWTESPIDGFPGFEVHPWYDDFSTPTFDGKHNLIKGGSWISTGNEILAASRYAFRRHFFQHAGFRMVISDSKPDIPVQDNVYETDSLVSQYCEFHYGNDYFGVENFPVACIRQVMSHITGNKLATTRALDLGCAVGRSAFELARHFEHVDAIDFSARFIRQAVNLQSQQRLRYTVPVEGDIVEYKEVLLDKLDYTGCKDRIAFMQGDACNLKPQFSDYDLVFAGNLIDRLYDPSLFLQSIRERLLPGGLLVLTSPYTWLEEYTEKANWLGGIKVNGENFSTLDALKQQLGENFELLQTLDIPFVIRETARKYQHSMTQMTVWSKRKE